MSDVWIVSDLHLGHSNIIKYCDRPFSSVEEMNNTIVDNWNKVVKDNDLVYNLGDVYFREGKNWLHYLKGRKILIPGNHDRLDDPVFRNVFEKVEFWVRLKDSKLSLTHVPFHEHEFVFGKVEKNVHGHIHQNVIPDPRYINVSVEQISYTPINLDEILKK